MAIDRARTALGQVFFQRCFYLFIGLLVLVPGPARWLPGILK